MENKDAKLIRKFITLVESVKPKTDEVIINENEEIEVQETEQSVDEQVSMFKDALLTLGRVAKEEKALWQEIKTQIPSIGERFKNVDELIAAIEGGKLTAIESSGLVKTAIKNSPELAMKIRGMISQEKGFAEIAKQVYPKGTLNPADPRKMEIAKKTLSQMGIEGKQADEMLKKAAQGAAEGGVSKKAIDKAIAKRAKELKGASAEVKAVETNVKTGGEAASKLQKTLIDGGGSLAAKWADKFRKGAEYLKNYKPNMFEKLKSIKSRLNWKNMVLYGLAGWGTIEILKSLFGDDTKGGVMPDCVVNLEGMEWGSTSGGDAMIYTKNEFDTKSKGHGGLKFYPNGRVWTMDNQMSGSYSCKAGKVEVSEEDVVTEQASRISITWDEKGTTPVPPIPTTDTGRTETEKITYTECKGFPLTYGCKGDMIKKLQVCIGLEGKYQTGNYGPITMKKLGGLKEVSKEKFDEIIKKCEGGQVSGTTTGNTTTTTGATTGNTTTTTGTTTTGTTTTSTGSTASATVETPSDLYARLVKAKTLVGRLRGRRIVYKGPDLTKEEREKLEVHMKKMGYRVSRDNFDFRKGDKIVFKRNNEEETTEPKGVTQEPTK